MQFSCQSGAVVFWGLLKFFYKKRLEYSQVRRVFSFKGDGVLFYEADVLRMVQWGSKGGRVPGVRLSMEKPRIIRMIRGLSEVRKERSARDQPKVEKDEASTT
jgi:hypothetical protein